MKEWITGRNPVYEVLSANRRHVYQLLINQTANLKGRLADIVRLCKSRDIPIVEASQQQLDEIYKNHQGVALETSAYPYSSTIEIIDRISETGQTPLLLLLDALQDPQNLGTLLRTAEGVGVHGIYLPLRKTAKITPAVVNASSGASEHLLITQVNLAQTIGLLKKEGIWVIGLEDIPQAQAPDQVRLDGPIALVVGSEGQGMRPLVRKSCDILMSLPMRGKIDSLNAAVAGSIALYLVWQRRGYSGIQIPGPAIDDY